MAREGILNIDKPQGITSHDAVQQLRRLSSIRRIGHAGTLDPLATGVLLLCIGRATRLVEYLMGQQKTYEVAVRLGQVTDSYDADGEIVAEHTVQTTPSEIEKALALFRGSIQQQAPVYSAIKQQGQPLYKLARAGKPVEAPVREVQIYSYELLSWDNPLIRLRVTCSAGTYIRSLAHDLGQTLGCGGHITELRRTAVGDFRSDEAVRIADLNEQNWLEYLRPNDAAVTHLPRLNLSDDEARRLALGQRIERLASQPDAAAVRAYDENGRFMGVATVRDETWQPHKMFPAET